MKALADVERAILDEKWDMIYARVEQRYLAHAGTPAPAALTQDDRRRIAANAAQVRNTILDDIATKGTDLVMKSRANARKVIEVNTVVQHYLLSLQEFDEARANIAKAINEITGVDLTGLSGVVNKTIKEFQ